MLVIIERHKNVRLLVLVGDTSFLKEIRVKNTNTVVIVTLTLHLNFHFFINNLLPFQAFEKLIDDSLFRSRFQTFFLYSITVK